MWLAPPARLASFNPPPVGHNLLSSPILWPEFVVGGGRDRWPRVGTVVDDDYASRPPGQRMKIPGMVAGTEGFGVCNLKPPVGTTHAPHPQHRSDPDPTPEMSFDVSCNNDGHDVRSGLHAFYRHPEICSTREGFGPSRLHSTCVVRRRAVRHMGLSNCAGTYRNISGLTHFHRSEGGRLPRSKESFSGRPYGAH